MSKKYKETKNQAIFLDRDGVINKKPPEHDYVKTWDEFELLDGVIDAIKIILDYEFLPIVISNQRGIARGLFTIKVLHKIHENLNKLLLNDNARIEAFYICPHDYKHNCNCRKPKPGMILQAQKEYDIDLSKSFFIGDSESDFQAGQKVGVETIIIPTNGSLLKVVKEIFDQKKPDLVGGH